MTATKADHLRWELLGVRKDMRSISPKTSTYERLEKRTKEIMRELEALKTHDAA